MGYKMGFVSDEAVWLTMLKKRNTMAHIYDENEVDELLLIRDSFTPAFAALQAVLSEKLAGAEDGDL